MLDYALVVLVCLGVWRGWRTGALRQLASLAALAAAFLFAGALADKIGEVVVESVGLSPRTAPAVGFLVVLVGIFAAAQATAHAARKVLQAVRLGGIDALVGGTIGGLKAALVLSCLLVALAALRLPGNDDPLVDLDPTGQSLLAEPVESLAPAAWRLFQRAWPGLRDWALDDGAEALEAVRLVLRDALLAQGGATLPPGSG